MQSWKLRFVLVASAVGSLAVGCHGGRDITVWNRCGEDISVIGDDGPPYRPPLSPEVPGEPEQLSKGESVTWGTLAEPDDEMFVWVLDPVSDPLVIPASDEDASVEIVGTDCLPRLISDDS